MKYNYDFTLYDYLSKKLKICYLTTDKSETNIRCPYCGDSIKNDYHAHLYINNLPPFKFYCQRCETSGIADSRFLNELNLYDPSIQNYVTKAKQQYARELSKKYGSNFFNYFEKEPILKPYEFGKLEKKKLSYINNRLGINLSTIGDIKRYRIILNLEDFFEKNGIHKNEYYKENIRELNNNYCAFLLNDRNMICFRSLEKNPKRRYINKKIYTEGIQQSRKFYTIKNEIDLSQTVHNIYLSEGIFDIMGVFNHIHDCNMHKNDIFAACNGKSYNMVLNYFKSLSILNCNIFIYSDKDVTIQTYKSLCTYNQLCKFNRINVFYNQRGKDCGCKKEDIELSERIIV